MKMISKKILVTTLVVLTFAVVVFAQPGSNVDKKEYVSKALDVCSSSLQEKVPGIVESTIYNIVLLKKFYPEANYKVINEELNNVAVNNPNAALRYKAHLASMYLSYGSNIEIVPQTKPMDHEYLFRQLADQLESKLLVTNE